MISNKKDLRSKYIEIRNALSEDTKIKASILMEKCIINNDLYKESDNILLFASYGSEINTFDLISSTLKLNKKLFLPKVCGDDLLFFCISSLDDLSLGYKGIYEPIGNTKLFDYEEADIDRTLIIMPGVVFDKNNNRLGYGKGFYDRFLMDKERLIKRSLAIGYKCQLADSLPADENDIKPECVYLF